MLPEALDGVKNPSEAVGLEWVLMVGFPPAKSFGVSAKLGPLGQPSCKVPRGSEVTSKGSSEGSGRRL